VAPDHHRAGAEFALLVAPAGGPDEPEPFEPSAAIYCGQIEDGPEAAHDHTVRVDLNGLLDPGTAYRYRFVYDEVASPVGRCRTLPAPDASPESISFAVLACQDYQNGYYGALGRVARETVDYLLHLGDFIYESADGRYRGLGSETYPDRWIDLPSGEPLAYGLADYRELYRTYRSDPLLARAAAAHTSIRTWDDHAVADNRYWDYEVDAPVAPNHPRGDDPEFMRELTAAGIRAFFEYTPERVAYDPDADGLQDAFRLYRSVRFGDLLELFVTDERLYRDPPPCAERPLPGWGPLCDERTDPDRSMLGDEQFDWLADGFGDAGTRWTGWANEVLTLPLRVGVSPLAVQPFVDSWDGYPAERRRLYRRMADNDRTAFVTLTGDLHSTVIGDQRLDGERVGIECMTPATTSVNGAEAVGVGSGLAGRLTRPLLSGIATATNPEMHTFDSHDWGYATATFGRERFAFDVYAVDKTVDGADAPRKRLAGTTVRRDRLL
jgi:alkaline phosphatase D